MPHDSLTGVSYNIINKRFRRWGRLAKLRKNLNDSYEKNLPPT
jgi:hypothetical protein